MLNPRDRLASALPTYGRVWRLASWLNAPCGCAPAQGGGPQHREPRKERYLRLVATACLRRRFVTRGCLLGITRCLLIGRVPDARCRSVHFARWHDDGVRSPCLPLQRCCRSAPFCLVPELSVAALAPDGAALPLTSRRCWREMSLARSRRSRSRLTRSDKSLRLFKTGWWVSSTRACSSPFRIRASSRGGFVTFGALSLR